MQVEKIIVEKLKLEVGDAIKYHCGINKFGKPQGTAIEVQTRANGEAVTEDIL